VPRDLPTGTVTFFFSDIQSSTALLQSLGDEYAAALEAQQKIVRAALAQHDGIELGTEGDSFFAVFASADAAVRAAVDAQRRLQGHQWPSGHQVRVRMGLHSGKGTPGGDNYVGLDVHRAARIAGAAHGGQVLVSGVTRGLAEHDLGDDVGFLDLGEHRLKDLTRPEHLHQLLIEGLAETFPPPESLTASARNLPSTLTSFVGRSSELEEMRALLRQERLVTLTGPGGVGKTRLAVELGRSLVPEFPDGIVFVALAQVLPGGSIPAEVATALSLIERADRPVERTVVDHLARRSMLLILDNCEHVREPVAAFTEAVMKASPASKVLATSREAISIAGEHLYRLDPLPLPDGAGSPDGSAFDLDVVRLFTDRAQAASAAFDPSGHADEILEICRRLDGIPLAIELAAARSSTLALPELLDRLEDRLTLLARGPRGSISPHETLEAAIVWSHDLLSDHETRLFRRIAVFEGGFDAEAAEAVCGGDATDDQVLDTLECLIAKSLVNVGMGSRRARYSMYEPIRAFASQRLDESDERDTLTGRHTAHFVERAHARSAELRTAGQLAALEDLEMNHANLAAVLTRSWELGDRDVALDLAATLTWFWYLHAHLSEGELWSERLLADDGSPPTRASVRLTIGAAEFDYRLGKHDRADTRLRGATTDARSVGSRSLEMWALSHLATNDLFQRSFESAAENARASIEIAEEVGSMGAAAYGSFLLIGIEAERLQSTGELDLEAAAHLHEKLAPLVQAARMLGDRNMIGHVLQGSGFLAAMADDRLAWSELDESLTAFGELRNAGCSAHCLEMVALAVGQASPEGSISLLAAASSVRRGAGVSTPPLESHTADIARAELVEALGAEEVERSEAAKEDVTLAEAIALGRAVLAEVAASDA
jgi:predicted ATPase/class 3 adenylate cyclase